MAITDAILHYRRFLKRRNYSGHTIKNYMNTLKHFVLWVNVPFLALACFAVYALARVAGGDAASSQTASAISASGLADASVTAMIVAPRAAATCAASMTRPVRPDALIARKPTSGPSRSCR